MSLCGIPKWERILSETDYILTISPDIIRLKEDSVFLLSYFFEAVHSPDSLINFIDDLLNLSDIEHYAKELNYDQNKLIKHWKSLISKNPKVKSNSNGIFFKLSDIPHNGYEKYTDVSDCLIYLYFFNNPSNYPAAFISDKMEIHIPINLNKLWIQNIHDENINNYIAHELSHYFNFIRSKGKSIQGRDKIIKSIDSQKIKMLKLNVTKDEIDSRINEISHLKSKSDRWDTFSFIQIINFVQTILSVIQYAYIGYYSESKETQLQIDYIIQEFLTNVYKRMARENLIGKNMRWNGNLAELKKEFQRIYK